ncbi:orotidine 5'-phosphate decarboxylase [Candidatus Nomurabacteria bacterium RIFCSPHIGHO2_02_FULL_41_18]|uniref:Orotidine-5'-phosphate decarboxylase n=1 Tax=Candidatus Nomurabacteria bacterium RIFCSPHIGHO2_02_FULL_41_18 TaxID=1801754 RepID=A0A1F6W5X3_9BACT|nr:MAG: orotidine 5'-phosphate decarboxylase [Candidatus Nomurabacteria bacterium RIFCSPHIGHO2_01_FULL_41_71]OGI77313.1 MAG: orotidine 5'-phosphate decarboxylase [Candidatus Nomurabacteria bacterium RIFCSPHIGHO2_02_FULL_41_18]OGI89711.1 MAG: orotidine 5'-phosphate decarboxylase [Candidatus Nomurabacteria bacterium RIFCSPLOWO2_01_FULL_41_52b]OGJ00215.1 MAG: orotidine 5'-phosphate decarboxylase [Candidatus Nomurabacteria bacterium RIFCSPLOWO2_02_FULL_41_9]
MIIDKYNQRAKKINSLLCVGLDSDFDKLPERFKARKFPQFEFNKWVIEETHEYAAAFKMNSAFFEARGDAGMKELKMTMDYLIKNHPDIFTILDAKRADIGNTNKGYVNAIFDWLGFDAVTLHPYLGKEALLPFLERKNKGCIILCRTSNPGAGELQDLKIVDVGRLQKPFWQIVAEKVSKEWNKNNNCLLVVGATYPEEMQKIRSLVGDMTFLVPGVGPQGGSVAEVMQAGLNSVGLGLIINTSRGIIFAADPKAKAQKLCEEIRKYGIK